MLGHELSAVLLVHEQFSKPWTKLVSSQSEYLALDSLFQSATQGCVQLLQHFDCHTLALETGI